MKRIIYSKISKKRYILLKYLDGTFVVISTRKPFNDVNDFPKQKVNVAKLTEISLWKYLYWKWWHERKKLLN